jgi:homospermidine synthase
MPACMPVQAIYTGYSMRGTTCTVHLIGGTRLTIEKKLASLHGRLVLVGFGGIGQGVLPLILRHIAIDPGRITILTADEYGCQFAQECGVADFRREPLSPENHLSVLGPLLSEGDFLLNLSVNVSSTALIELCRERGALYLDSCLEPWEGGYVDANLTTAQRTNYVLREEALSINRRSSRKRPTAVVTHGVNPGLISHFTKQALLDMARDLGNEAPVPAAREGWARLAMHLGIKAIHVAERDSQVGTRPRRQGEFVNTWSAEAFISEGSQPAELGWGTHERSFPEAGRVHTGGCGAAIYLERPGVSVRVRSWTPLAGAYHGFLITHAESISIADYLSVYQGSEPVYRPTVHYAYHPCDDAVLSIDEFVGRDYLPQASHRLLRDEITTGTDELGILLCGNPRGVYWYGSRLDVVEARRLAPRNNATTLQTAAGVLAGLVWAIENRERGVVEADDMDFERVLEIARPYLGTMVGVWGDWTPLQGRQELFREALDRDDPWQFGNVLVR